MDELAKLRQRERRILRDLDSPWCVGAHRDSSYKELESVRKQIKYVWWKIHNKG